MLGGNLGIQARYRRPGEWTVRKIQSSQPTIQLNVHYANTKVKGFLSFDSKP